MSDPVNVLFLCTGNSCRSQMAEGWLRAIGGDHVRVQSAGIEAHGKNPRAVAAMKEIGIDISEQESKVLNDDMLRQADVVITVCGHAEEQCPYLPQTIKKLHWPLTDPAKATGADKEITQAFTTTRDQIERRVRKLFSESLVEQ